MKRIGSRFFLASALLVLTAALLLGHAGTATANVPTVLQIVNISQAAEGIIRLQITHSSPSPSHFVDKVEVQVGGTTKQFTLTQQTSDPFTVELNLGPLQGTPDVRARAHCTLHGWSDWSQTIPVPEFPTVAVVGFALLAATLVFRRTTLLGQNKRISG